VVRVFCGRGGRGFTLAEVVVSLGVLSVVLAGLASTLTITMRIAPRGNEPSVVIAQLTRALQSIADEVVTAVGVEITGPSSLTVLVPDRSGDNAPETIAYTTEAGSRGISLLRRYNGGPAEVIATGLGKVMVEGPGDSGHPLGLVTITAYSSDQRVPPIRVVAHWLNHPS